MSTETIEAELRKRVAELERGRGMNQRAVCGEALAERESDLAEALGLTTDTAWPTLINAVRHYVADDAAARKAMTGPVTVDNKGPLVVVIQGSKLYAFPAADIVSVESVYRCGVFLAVVYRASGQVGGGWICQDDETVALVALEITLAWARGLGDAAARAAYALERAKALERAPRC